MLQWLRPDEDQLLDLGALYFADEIALALLGPGVEVTPVENTDYMYSTSTWPLDWLVGRELGEPIDEDERPIPIALAFPARERYTILLHCLFAHELSHAAVRVEKLVERGLEPLRNEGPFQKWLDEACDRAGPWAPAVRETAPERAEVWLEELFCDALAFALLGPAYLFAFAEMGLSVGRSEPDDEHPSMAMRTRLLVRQAERYGWSDFLQGRLPVLWAWLELTAEAPSILGGVVESFAERVCRGSFERIYELVDELLDEMRFTPSRWEEHERHLAELLENDVLPVVTVEGKPLAHAEILTASWLQALAKHGNTPSAISKVVAEDDYQRFVAEALEMSTALRMWSREESCDAAAT